ncbi:ribosome biogenesis protein WDR12 homolog [Anabrus simplex]|uniref:ribosome biogenesis protein WDR12 homolog n=1 Tax=Anabrus simplex TaxID=316456 RepID=UPI0034DD8329
MGDQTIEVILTTSQQQYAVPSTPLSISSTVGPVELNALVNALLEESQPDWKKIDFDFLVSNEFIRGPLKNLLGPAGGETKVVIEYLESRPAPEPEDCLLHDDWVSAVQVSDKWILTGCYDNSLHIWTKKGAHKLSISAHDGPVKGVAWIENDGSSATFVSASCDQTAKVWKWSVGSDTAKCMFVCRGHERSLTSVSVNPTHKLMATGSWDALLKIWSAGLEDASPVILEETPAKKMKHEKSPVRTPILTLKGHQGVISSTVWTEVDELCTASWDHTLRLWDAELGGVKLDITFNKAFQCIDWSPLNKTLLSSSADRHVRLHDLRSAEYSQVQTTFTNHTKLVTSVHWSRGDENLFISGGHDNEVKLWDRRSFRTPLYNLGGHEDQVLCCNWSEPQLIVSGGADKTVHIFKTKHAKQYMLT